MESENTSFQLSHAEFRTWVAIEVVDVYVCSKWELKDSIGKHIGIGYIFSNNQGDVIQGEARCGDPSSLVCCLDKEHAYKLQYFRVLPISTSLCFSRHATAALQLDAQTTVQQISCCLQGFVCYPLSPVAVEDISYTQGKYSIGSYAWVNHVPGEHVLSNQPNVGSMKLWNEKMCYRQRREFLLDERKKRKVELQEENRKKREQRIERKMAQVAREREWAQRLAELQTLEKEKLAIVS